MHSDYAHRRIPPARAAPVDWRAVTERTLDHDTVGRVLRRASDLADGGPSALPAPSGVSERALVEAAAEVGIPLTAVRRALAIEQLDPVPRRKVGDRVVGAAVVTVDGEVVGSATDVLARFDAWFVDGHHLHRHRVRDGHGVWTKRRGLVGRTVRTVRGAIGEGQLGRMRRVDVSTGDTGIGTTVVRVEVDRSRDRKVAAVAGTAVAAMATVGTVALAAATAPVLLVAAPLGLAAGVRVAGGGRGRATAVAGEVDRVLDAVDGRVSPTPPAHGCRPSDGRTTTRIDRLTRHPIPNCERRAQISASTAHSSRRSDRPPAGSAEMADQRLESDEVAVAAEPGDDP